MLQCGIDPGYVLDEMQFYEVEALIENLWMKDKESWEQTRAITYVTAQCQSTKKLDMKEMMTFPWEKGEKIEDNPEELEAVREEMKLWQKRMNKKR